MDHPDSFTPEALDIFRKAVSLKIAFWDATADLERFIGFEINDDAFANAACGMDFPAQAMEITDEDATDFLVDQLSEELYTG